MATEYKLDYTGAEINAKLGKIDAEKDYCSLLDLMNYEFITIEDIDAICGGSIQAAREEGVTF